MNQSQQQLRLVFYFPELLPVALMAIGVTPLTAKTVNDSTFT